MGKKLLKTLTLWMAALLLLPFASVAAVSMGTITLKVGEKYHADARYSVTTTIQQGTWSQSNSNIVITAKGNASCTIRGNKVGTARLSYSGTAAPPNSWSTFDIDCYWTINVVADEDDAKVSSLGIDQKSATIHVSNNITLFPLIQPSNASNKKVEWSSSNSNIARVVSPYGTWADVYGESEGTARITCKTTDGSNLVAYCDVRVEINGSTFYYDTKEGVKVQYQIIDDKAKTCRVWSDWVSGVSYSALYDRSASGTLTIPQYADGYKVVEIGEGAFTGCSNLASVIFPEGVETIGENIFSGSKSLNSVTIPSTLKKIGSYAFSVNSLATINGPMDQLEYIGGGAFYNSAWYKVFLENQPDGAVYIGKVLYDIKTPSSYNIEDRQLVVKDGTTMISGNCFFDTHYYTDIIIPASTTMIEVNEDFGLNAKLNSITVSADNPVYDSRDNCNAIIETATNKLIAGCGLTVIPESVTEIGHDAFAEKSIGSIVIPDAVESVGEKSFSAAGLESVIIGMNVREIGKYAFFRNHSLLNITSKIENPTPISDWAFFYDTYNKDSLYIYENATLYVPVGTKSKYASTEGWKRFKNIVEGAYEPEYFSEVTKDNFKVKYHVISQDEKTCEVSKSAIGAFVNRYRKGELTIPAYANGYKVVKIGDEAFSYSDSTIHVNMPVTIRSIGKDAFYHCSMDSVTIPASVDSIGNLAFYDCPNLKSITSLIRNPFAIPQMAFDSSALSSCTLYVPAGTKALYEATDGWKRFKNIVEFGSLTSKGDVNGDGVVDGIDVVALSNLVLANSTKNSVADVNGDGVVDGVDIVALANTVLDGGNNAKAKKLKAVAAAATGISFEPFTISAGEEKEVTLDMTNPSDSITLVQFDMVLPEGLSLKQSGGDYGIDIAGRTTWRRHTLNARDNGGFVRFLMYSATNALIEGSEGALIKMTLVADESFKGGDIRLENILLVTPEEKGIRPDAYVYSLAAPEEPAETGISVEPFTIEAGEEKEVTIDMTNPDDNITLVQFDMVLPEGLSLKQSGGDYDIDIAGRTTWRKHTLNARDNGGFIRFLMYSATNALIEGSEGALIKMTLVADESFKGGKIGFENILLVTPEEKGIRPASFEVDAVSKSVGIDETTVGGKPAARIYDLSGRRLAKPQKGINIIDGKKVLIK